MIDGDVGKPHFKRMANTRAVAVKLVTVGGGAKIPSSCVCVDDAQMEAISSALSARTRHKNAPA
ncbi:hypothetical protein D3C78_1902180 [compost metagenome]